MCCTYDCKQGRGCSCVLAPCRSASPKTPPARGQEMLASASAAADSGCVTLQRADCVWIAFSLLVFCASLYGLFQLG